MVILADDPERAMARSEKSTRDRPRDEGEQQAGERGGEGAC